MPLHSTLLVTSYGAQMGFLFSFSNRLKCLIILMLFSQGIIKCGHFVIVWGDPSGRLITPSNLPVQGDSENTRCFDKPLFSVI